VEDLSKLIFEVLGLRERVMVFLDFGTGLRRGELSGLKWEDVDFERGQLQPKRSIVRQHIGPTKTEASRKPIPLDEHLLGDLRDWRSQTPYTQDGDFIFASPKMDGKQPYWLESIIKRPHQAGSEKVRHQPQGLAHAAPHLFNPAPSQRERSESRTGTPPARQFEGHDGHVHASAECRKRQAHRRVIRLVVPRQAPRRFAGAL